MQFYDAANWRNLPTRGYAALYHDGLYAAPPDAPTVLQLTGARWITVTGDYRNCGIIDFEAGNLAYSAPLLRAFVRGRRAMGARARVYCDRADAAETLAALTASPDSGLVSYSGLYWWIATLDGSDWTPEELAADLAAHWEAPIPVGRIWANQNIRGAKFDTSTLFLDW